MVVGIGCRLRNQVLSTRSSLYEVHHEGKSPVITDESRTIAESGAIVEYIVSRYGNGKLIPSSDTPEYLRYTYWLHYALRFCNATTAY